MTTITIGQTIGNYVLERELGTGGMGTVYLARHRHLPRQAAVKVMRPEFSADPRYRERFLREAAAVATLDHPHLVRIYDSGEQDGILYQAVEYLEAGSLYDLLKQQPDHRLELPLALDLAHQAAEGLDYAHQHGIIHRDIKPSNLLLRARPDQPAGSPAYTLKIGDFGLARSADDTQVTQAGATVGTPAYMAPEQHLGKELDGRCDIYALGVVLYELLTGQRPFTARTSSEAYYQHTQLAPPPPRDVNPRLPEAVEAIVLRCLAKERDDRYATAGDLAVALDKVLHELMEKPPVSDIPTEGPNQPPDQPVPPPWSQPPPPVQKLKPSLPGGPGPTEGWHWERCCLVPLALMGGLLVAILILLCWILPGTPCNPRPTAEAPTSAVPATPTFRIVTPATPTFRVITPQKTLPPRPTGAFPTTRVVPTTERIIISSANPWGPNLTAAAPTLVVPAPSTLGLLPTARAVPTTEMPASPTKTPVIPAPKGTDTAWHPYSPREVPGCS